MWPKPTQGPGCQPEESDLYQGGDIKPQKSFKLKSDIIKAAFWKVHFRYADNSLV